MNDANREPRYFHALQQAAFLKLGQAASLKGLLKPFKGKGDLEAWASQCFAMRDELIALAQRQVLQQAVGHPFHLLPVELAQQATGAGTTFLRWRRHDRSAMGVALWQELIASTSTPVNLLADLHAIELQRITLNMQISLLHTLGRQAQECASKAAEAEDAYLRRMAAINRRRPPERGTSA
ncbi:MAG: integrase [Burkholderiales bacterium RIFCSPHIGHO2_01_FULL_64_960]|nr:MAG: integrase [Burkholderiales bacterium RIFCSPHIGHO2_01_FULL_64_960]